MLSCFVDDDDIKRQVRALYIRGNFLARNFSFCSVDVKVKLSFVLICTVVICGHISKTVHTTKLEWHTIIVFVYFLA